MAAREGRWWDARTWRGRSYHHSRDAVGWPIGLAGEISRLKGASSRSGSSDDVPRQVYFQRSLPPRLDVLRPGRKTLSTKSGHDYPLPYVPGPRAQHRSLPRLIAARSVRPRPRHAPLPDRGGERAYRLISGDAPELTRLISTTTRTRIERSVANQSSSSSSSSRSERVKASRVRAGLGARATTRVVCCCRSEASGSSSSRSRPPRA